jgi:putative transposase
MARRSRVVIPDIPHHITQRGNNGRDVFFRDADRTNYLGLLGQYCSEYGVSVVGYCLMTNHVHLIAIPAQQTSLAKALGRTHNDYSRWLNVGRQESGHVWQNRFYSCPLDMCHLWHSLAYTERNPVRAGMVAAAEHWRWSSAAAHLQLDNANDCLQMEGWWERWSADQWRTVLEHGLEEACFQARIAEATSTGRPLGDDAFVHLCERRSGMVLRPQKRGPKLSGPGNSGAVMRARAANLYLW